MRETAWLNLIAAIHGNEHQAVLAITGGGSAAIGELLEVSGGSRTLLEAIVPYASTALADWLGSVAEQSCSESTARAMAMASWMRARSLSPDTDPSKLVGVGATASLASDRPKKGEHRVHVATQTATTTASYSLILSKNQRDRIAEENLACKLVLLGLGKACQLGVEEARAQIEGQLLENEKIEFSQKKAESAWTELLLGERSQIGYRQTDEVQAIFPGAFNPPHKGHRRIVAIAEKRLRCPVVFELSITNVDKPPLDFWEIEDRLQELSGETASDASISENLLLTDAPTFRAKSELFPGCTFVVGADTIARVGDPKYYTGESGSFDAAIRQIADRGCRFLVFGREIDGRFQVLSDLELPPALQELCDEVSVEEFREDVSSSEIRQVARLSES